MWASAAALRVESLLKSRQSPLPRFCSSVTAILLMAAQAHCSRKSKILDAYLEVLTRSRTIQTPAILFRRRFMPQNLLQPTLSCLTPTLLAAYCESLTRPFHQYVCYGYLPEVSLSDFPFDTSQVVPANFIVRSSYYLLCLNPTDEGLGFSDYIGVV